MRIVTVILSAFLISCGHQGNIAPKKADIKSLVEPLAIGINGKLAFSDGTVGGYSSGFAFDKVEFSPSGRLVGGIAAEGLFVWDIVNQPILNTSLKTRISCVRFVNDETALLLGGVDGRVYRWKFLETDTPKKPSLERYIGHGSVVSAVSGGVETPIFFSGDWLGVVSVWLPYDSDRFRGRFDENLFGNLFFTDINKVRETKKVNAPIEVMAATRDRLFIGQRDGKLEVWNIRGLNKRHEVIAHQGGIYLMDVGEVLVTAGRDGVIKLWNFDLELITSIQQGGAKALRLDGEDLVVLLESGSISKYRVIK